MDIKAEEFLNQLLDYERRVGRLYFTLGLRSSFSADFRSFWHHMAEDERHHATVLERSRSLIPLQQEAPQALAPMFHAIEQQLTAAEEAVDHIDLSANEALRYALLLESSELNQLETSWRHTFPPSLSTVLTLLSPEDNLHLRRLVEAVHAFSTDKLLQEQATALWVKSQTTKVM
jgi:hypothetical protein